MIETKPEPHYEDYDWGISCIDVDLFRTGLASCYLIEQDGMAAFIDTGTGHSVPLLLEVLRRKGIERELVAYVIPTHVHLDHAGGVGGLMQALPEAQLLIHPRGARHMIDPAKLQAGATAVYGEARYQRLFGELIPVLAERVREMQDGEQVEMNGRLLTFHDTPGHARHHFCIEDSRSRGLFTGDTFGVSYPELNGPKGRFIFPPSTPVQFDPEAWHESVERLMALKPERVFLTHFGKQEKPQELAPTLHAAIDRYADMARSLLGHRDRLAALTEAMREDCIRGARATGCDRDENEIERLLEVDIQLNAQGLEHWLQQESE